MTACLDENVCLSLEVCKKNVTGNGWLLAVQGVASTIKCNAIFIEESVHI